jgi:hypothetical protein
MWITYFVVSNNIHTFVTMSNVYDIKRHQKLVKKHGTFNLNDEYAVGELKITRCKLKISPISGDVRLSEIDIIYKGRINQWGRWMGPKRQVDINNTMRGYGSTWRSTIHRNKEFRRMVRSGVISYLKYLGVYIPYQHNLHINKIVWKDSGI